MRRRWSVTVSQALCKLVAGAVHAHEDPAAYPVTSFGHVLHTNTHVTVIGYRYSYIHTHTHMKTLYVFPNVGDSAFLPIHTGNITTFTSSYD